MIEAKTVRNFERWDEVSAETRRAVVAVVNETAVNIHRDAQLALSSMNPPAVDTGGLRGTTVIRIKEAGAVAHIGTVMKHGLYVEYGTAPHFPPVSALVPWVNRHKGAFGIRGKSAAAEIKSIAFLIARKISKHGTKARPWLLPAYNRHVKDIGPRLRRMLQG